MPSADQKTESPGKAFIPASLDDAGLKPTEFRVYCAILRRGECFESVPKIAQRCHMHRDTVWAALKSLEARGAVVKTSRPGHTTLLTALPVNLWTQASGNEGPAETKGYPSKPGDTQPLNSATTQPEIRGSHPAETKGYKGNPIEGSLIKFLPAKEAHIEKPKLEEVLAEAKSIGLAEWKARDWFDEMEGCGWIDEKHQPIRSWRVTLDFIRFKWDMDGRRQSPGSRGSNPAPTETQPEVNQKPTTRDKQTKIKPLANA